MLDHEAKRARISVIAELASELPRLWADSTQIQQVLINLLRNAFDSLRQSQVLDPIVIMRTKRIDSGDVCFEVEDNGEGIEESDLAKVFDAYYSTRAEGMGMGLAICRSVIEAHHGALEAGASPLGGARFTFTLPLAEATETRDAAEPARP